MASINGIDHKFIALPVVAASLGLTAYAAYRLHRSTVLVPGSDVYESEKLLSEYLVFHFGTPEELIPYPFGPKDALDFPKRCAELCLKHYKPKVLWDFYIDNSQKYLQMLGNANFTCNFFTR